MKPLIDCVRKKAHQRPWIDRVEDPSPVKNSNTQNPEENPKEKTKENLWKSAASNRILEHTRRLQSVLSDFKGNSFPPKQSDSPQKKEEALQQTPIPTSKNLKIIFLKAILILMDIAFISKIAFQQPQKQTLPKKPVNGTSYPWILKSMTLRALSFIL